jgi:hypothetical protein
MNGMTTEARAATVEKFAAELPALLSKQGETWRGLVKSPGESHAWVRIEREDGASLSIHVEGYRNEGKLTVSGNWPTLDKPGRNAGTSTFYPGRGGFSAKISLTKTSEVIAREIERRVLAKYLPLYQEALAAKNAAIDHYQKTHALGVELARIAGKREPEDAERVTFKLDLEGDGYGDVTVNSPGSVSIEIRSTNPETARRVLAALKSQTS